MKKIKLQGQTTGELLSETWGGIAFKGGAQENFCSDGTVLYPNFVVVEITLCVFIKTHRTVQQK